MTHTTLRPAMAAYHELIATQAHRLALELECLLLDTQDLSLQSKWWESAHAALDLYRWACNEGRELLEQAEANGGAPCARHCESTAFKLEIRRLTGELARARAAQPVAWMYDWEGEHHDCAGAPCGREVFKDWITQDYDEAHSPTHGCHNIRPLFLRESS